MQAIASSPGTERGRRLGPRVAFGAALAASLFVALAAAPAAVAQLAPGTRLAQALPGTPPPTARALAPLVEGPFVGVLPCADCEGIRTELTLYRAAGSRVPAFFHLRRTYIGKEPEAIVETQGPWTEPGSGPRDRRVRIDPFREQERMHLRRVDDATLELLDRDEKPIETRANLRLVRRAGLLAQPATARPFFAGTVQLGGDGQFSFRPCRDPAVVRLVDATPERALAPLLVELAGDKRRPLYLEGWGRLRDGRVLIEQLNRAGTEIACAPGGVLQSVRWQAQGNEPFWALASRGASIALTEPGGVVWSAPDVPLSWVWRSGRPERAAELELRTESLRVDLHFEPATCRDSMADVAYGWKAELRVQPADPQAEPRLMGGCAYLGERTRLP